jgi:hypothetical protein
MPKCVIASNDGMLPITLMAGRSSSLSPSAPNQLDVMLKEAVRAGAEARNKRATPKLMKALKVVDPPPNSRKRAREESQDDKQELLSVVPLPKRIRTPLFIHKDAAVILGQPGRYRCMWDMGKFEGIPAVAPTRYDEAKDSYRVRGIYCGLGCAKRSLMTNDAMRERRLSWFSDIARRHYGFGYRRRITPAGERETLIKFGGKYTTKEFREKCNNGIITSVLYAPLTFDDMHIDELDVKSARAHVEWIQGGRGTTTVKTEPAPSPVQIMPPQPPAPVPMPMAPLLRPHAGLAAEWFSRLSRAEEKAN